MLVDGVEQTIALAGASMRRARGDEDVVDRRAPGLYLESLGICEAEKEEVLRMAGRCDLPVDPVVAFLIAATSGNTYKHLVGRLDGYPIPELRLQNARGKRFLDLGCNWGRWCIAAARKGYEVVGIDPSQGAIMAARRVARQLDLPIRYIVGDARYLPFEESSFDIVFSYSVLQHLGKDRVKTVLSGVERVLKPGGASVIQMANFLGVRCLQQQLRRGFREARDFEVRYWSIPEVKKTFAESIGDTTISADCYFGLGLQKNAMGHMPFRFKLLIALSECMRRISESVGLLTYVADSIYVKSVKAA